MSPYQQNPEFLKKYDQVPGAPLYRPKYRCADCSNPIDGGSDHTLCYQCGVGNLDISPIKSIEGVFLYFNKREWGDVDGPVIDDLIQFSKEILEAKGGGYTDKMSEILMFGIKQGAFSNFDAAVVPPSSSSGPNHMVPKAETVETRTGIEFVSCIVDTTGGKEMKKITSAEKRREIARDRYECQADVEDERILILDDIVTSCATSVGVAEALRKKGASQIGVVSMTRSVDVYGLKNRNLIVET